MVREAGVLKRGTRKGFGVAARASVTARGADGDDKVLDGQDLE